MDEQGNPTYVPNKADRFFSTAIKLLLLLPILLFIGRIILQEDGKSVSYTDFTLSNDSVPMSRWTRYL